jgi:predicted transposase YdaD
MSKETQNKWEQIIVTMKGEAEFDSHISKTSISKLEQEKDRLIQEAFERGKEEMIEEDMTPVYLKGILKGKEEARLQTLEEVERGITGHYYKETELNDFFDKAIKTINKMK